MQGSLNWAHAAKRLTIVQVKGEEQNTEVL